MDVVGNLTDLCVETETVLTIGAYDGLHRGHQEIVRHVVQRARATRRLATLITFHPHPAVVLAPERAPRYLTTPGEKVALLERMGLDLVVLLPFDRDMAACPARDFVSMLVAHLRPAELWVGRDFALGRDREGDAAHLRELSSHLGFDLHVVDPVVDENGIISSSRIRRLLREGNVSEAARLLGRYPSLSGEVVVGAQRGRTLGFPTANLEVRPERAVPADGVYAVYAVLGQDRYPAVANVGVRPSFDNGQRTVEIHIFDFAHDIYGCDLVVEFVARLRPERRFDSIDELVSQIDHDSREALRILDGADIRTPQQSGGTCAFSVREVEHTADRALEVRARELPGLFGGAARGMYSLMADLNGLVPTMWRDVHLDAADTETLFVDWLNELLFLTEIEGIVFLDWQIELLSETSLLARVGGVIAPLTKAHIKAATFHNLVLSRTEKEWSTVITFDV